MSRRGPGTGRWALGRGSYQILQGPLSGIEYPRAWEPHVLRVGQVGDGEVDSKTCRRRGLGCSGGGEERAALSVSPGQERERGGEEGGSEHTLQLRHPAWTVLGTAS